MNVNKITLGLSAIVAAIAIAPYTSRMIGSLVGHVVVVLALGGLGIVLVRRGLLP